MAYAQQDNFMGPGDFFKHGRKTEATLAQESSVQGRHNSQDLGHIFGHNSGAKGPTEVRTGPKETRDRDPSDGKGLAAVGSQKRVVLSVQN